MAEDSLLSRMVYVVTSIAEREQRGPADRELSWSMADGLRYDGDDRAVLFSAADLASLVGQSPVVLTRGLKKLEAAGILNPKKGPGGGGALARPASSITIYSIYAALYDADQHPVRGAPADMSDSNCPVRVVASQTLGQLYEAMAASCREAMDTVTIAAVVGKARRPLRQFFDAVQEGVTIEG